MLFFILYGSDLLGKRIAEQGGFDIADHEERSFDGSEHKTRPLTSVRGRDVYVLHSLHGTSAASANDKLCRLLFFIAACKQNGASRVTAIVSYLAYSRKDRQTKPRDPVTTRYVAQLFEAAGTDMIITLDVHTIIAFQNAFRCSTLHLDSHTLFAREIEKRTGENPVAVVSPDGGGIKRAQLLRELLCSELQRDIGFGFTEKRRSAGVVSGTHFAGDEDGRDVFIIDDMIVGGGTIIRAAAACRDHGAASVHALAAHGLFSAASETLFTGNELDSITVTDSVAPFEHNGLADSGKLTVLSVANLFTETIKRLHNDLSIDELIEFGQASGR